MSKFGLSKSMPTKCVVSVQRDGDDRAHFMSASDGLAGQGERVLALAWLDNPA
jgi:hypothetical protein